MILQIVRPFQKRKEIVSRSTCPRQTHSLRRHNPIKHLVITNREPTAAHFSPTTITIINITPTKTRTTNNEENKKKKEGNQIAISPLPVASDNSAHLTFELAATLRFSLKKIFFFFKNKVCDVSFCSPERNSKREWNKWRGSSVLDFIMIVQQVGSRAENVFFKRPRSMVNNNNNVYVRKVGQRNECNPSCGPFFFFENCVGIVFGYGKTQPRAM